ncbi:hypothetical protein V8E36_009756 [Tilletia maclaganii]
MRAGDEQRGGAGLGAASTAWSQRLRCEARRESASLRPPATTYAPPLLAAGVAVEVVDCGGQEARAAGRRCRRVRRYQVLVRAERGRLPSNMAGSHPYGRGKPPLPGIRATEAANRGEWRALPMTGTHTPGSTSSEARATHQSICHHVPASKEGRTFPAVSGSWYCESARAVERLLLFIKQSTPDCKAESSFSPLIIGQGY